MPPQHFFPKHQHEWHQLLYATSGVLIVEVLGERLFIPPEKAVWIPQGHEHQVYSEYGSSLKSLYIEHSDQFSDWQTSKVLKITPLLKQLILEASTFSVHYSRQGYEAELIALMLASLHRLETDHDQLPWPASRDLYRLCQMFYEQPSLRKTTAKLAIELSVSKRTLERKFMKETGMSVQQWLLQLRFLKSLELLSAGYSITHIALELGYGSSAAFIHMFRDKTGVSPGQFIKNAR
ncbi:transcriptional regulator, AraC family protein [Oceanospirillum sp. MED92]|uniref:Transcriptional regulator, AraC family protein n=2 Tax=Neptuniibacter caesariensis TaxID=207954 RepID=A0A7U8GU18_NEPCE|nr:transcriptional regulator, AraC family protein [Oceanospirillum sp. MED92] [Neptuniibacter caesariensis]